QRLKGEFPHLSRAPVDLPLDQGGSGLPADGDLAVDFPLQGRPLHTEEPGGEMPQVQQAGQPRPLSLQPGGKLPVVDFEGGLSQLQPREEPQLYRTGVSDGVFGGAEPKSLQHQGNRAGSQVGGAQNFRLGRSGGAGGEAEPPKVGLPAGGKVGLGKDRRRGAQVSAPEFQVSRSDGPAGAAGLEGEGFQG